MNNGTGYWAYEFTLQEIKQLKLKQRIPEARTTVFDGLFEIPTLTEILQLLMDWNENMQPKLLNLNSTSVSSFSFNKLYYPPPPRGIYAELKDFPWLMQDTNGKINLLDIFFAHIQENSDLWKQALLQHMCDTKALKEHQYKLPPLILQSFQADVLRNFTHMWEAMAHNNENKVSLLTVKVPDPENPTSTLSLPIPVPPTILLVSRDKCQTEEFWFEMDDQYREFIRGIGIDKQCFFVQGGTNTNGKGKETEVQYQPSIMEKALKGNWVVHPWTERPEAEFFVNVNGESRRRQKDIVGNGTSNHTPPSEPQGQPPLLSPFSTVMEELMFFKCQVGIHGIFSESVDVAVRAMNMDCPTEGSNLGSSPAKPSSPNACPSSSTTKVINTNNIPLGPVILFSFFLGIFAALVVWRYFCSDTSSLPGRRWRQINRNGSEEQNGSENGRANHDVNRSNGGIMMTKTSSRRRHGRQHSALATSEDEADLHLHENDLTLTDEDHEVL
jgi:hypothetical protein